MSPEQRREKDRLDKRRKRKRQYEARVARGEKVGATDLVHPKGCECYSCLWPTVVHNERECRPARICRLIRGR
jgi:hypothetical protein